MASDWPFFLDNKPVCDDLPTFLLAWEGAHSPKSKAILKGGTKPAPVPLRQRSKQHSSRESPRRLRHYEDAPFSCDSQVITVEGGVLDSLEQGDGTRQARSAEQSSQHATP
ncbi:hypothetical protein Q7P37_002115 [Cladosporium fusiforme]